jgi:type IV pilus assembly protein PilA
VSGSLKFDLNKAERAGVTFEISGHWPRPKEKRKVRAMFSAIKKHRDKRAEGDEGFTLIELLVVIIIIGILAAIAIPVFLNQREKGWDAQAESDIRNAAVIQETHFTEEGNYGDLAAIQAAPYNWRLSADTTDAIVEPEAPTTAYCIQVTSKSGDDFAMSSVSGSPAEGTCSDVGAFVAAE